MSSQLGKEIFALSAEILPWVSCSPSTSIFFLNSWFFRNTWVHEDVFLGSLKNHAVLYLENGCVVWGVHSLPDWRAVGGCTAAGVLHEAPVAKGSWVSLASALGSLSENWAQSVAGVWGSGFPSQLGSLLHRCHPLFVLIERTPFYSLHSFLFCVTSERTEPCRVLRAGLCVLLSNATD